MDDFQVRLKKFQEELDLLIKKYDVEPIPTILHGPSALLSSITLIDLKNEAMLVKYGRTKVNKDDSSPSGAPQNPLAN
jgi:hypothetical protein